MEHQKQWDFLKQKFEANQLSHAYLFTGQEGIGKAHFAKELVKLINGKIFEGVIEKEQFPDLLVVKSANSESSQKNEKDMMEIDVTQIRDVNNFLSYKSYYGTCKTVIIENAERMNHEAQNSFLKTLEEPKGKTLIILISSKPALLLPTIFSRCQTLSFFSQGTYQPTNQEQKTLQELLGIINSELALKFQYTKKVNLEGDNINSILQVLQRYFRGLMLQKLGVVAVKSQEANNYSVAKVKDIIRLIEKLQTQLATTNASPKLALEILLMEI